MPAAELKRAVLMAAWVLSVRLCEGFPVLHLKFETRGACTNAGEVYAEGILRWRTRSGLPLPENMVWICTPANFRTDTQ